MVAINRIIIGCAGDSDLATELHLYMTDGLKTIQPRIDECAALAIDEIEISDTENKISLKNVRNVLQSFLGSDRARFKAHQVIEFENTFTIGIKIDLLAEMKACEYCGYISKDYDDMAQHRLLCTLFVRRGI